MSALHLFNRSILIHQIVARSQYIAENVFLYFISHSSCKRYVRNETSSCGYSVFRKPFCNARLNYFFFFVFCLSGMKNYCDVLERCYYWFLQQLSSASRRIVVHTLLSRASKHARTILTDYAQRVLGKSLYLCRHFNCYTHLTYFTI